LKQIEEKLNELEVKINLFEQRQREQLAADLFHGDLCDYVVTLRQKQLYYLYDILKTEDTESQSETIKRVIKDLIPSENHPITYIHRLIRFLLRNLNEMCTNNNLIYWFELTSLSGAVKLADLQPGDDHATIGMPIEDINQLASLLQNDAIFRLSVSYSFTKSGYIKLYRFMLYETNVTWIDIFSYHYADFDTVLHKKDYWKRFLQLKSEYSRDSQALEELCQQTPELGSGKDILVTKYIQLQAELINTSGNRKALFWGIENFTYGKPNILNLKKLFPLQKQILWGEAFPVCDSNGYLINERNVEMLAFPKTNIERLHKIQYSEEEYYLDLVRRLEND
jgi:hypothetical protein